MKKKLSRREFMKLAGLGAGAVFVGGTPFNPGKAPAQTKGTTIHMLQWGYLVAEANEEYKRQGEEFGKQAGCKVVMEFINMNDLQPRCASAIQANTGPDIIQAWGNWPHLYEEALVDVSDIVAKLEKEKGPFYQQIAAHTKVGRVWRAVPYAYCPQAFIYRVDWFKEVGEDKFPETLDDLRRVGKKLKANGHPIGQCFGHSMGDPNGWCYSILWMFGGQEIADDRKTLAIDSKETREAIKFTVAMWKDAFDESGLAWDDSSNNRAYLSGQNSATLNGASIWVVAKSKFPDIAKVSSHANMPKGPKGIFQWHATMANMVMKYSKEQKLAKDFIAYLMSKEPYIRGLEVNGAYMTPAFSGLEDHPFWDRLDPQVRIFSTLAKYGRSQGWAGPPNRASSEVQSKYIIVDMFAKAIAIKGEDIDACIKWAASELKKIYHKT